MKISKVLEKAAERILAKECRDHNHAMTLIIEESFPLILYDNRPYSLKDGAGIFFARLYNPETASQNLRFKSKKHAMMALLFAAECARSYGG